MRPRLLDLFCGAGGAGTGYARAGFEVVGVDVRHQPRYPFEFVQADATKLRPAYLATFDAIHASPPCQAYSDLGGETWRPRLILPIRRMLERSGKLYVIENVETAPLHYSAITLCGTMFPGLRVLRHRKFETNFPVGPLPPHGDHPLVHTLDKRRLQFGKTDEHADFVQVTGGGNCTLAAASTAMGIDWMTKREINEAIPPAYTRFIGLRLKRALKGRV